MNEEDNINKNENFFSKLEIKPVPKVLTRIKPLPSVKLELKNAITKNLDENEKLNTSNINSFIGQILMKDEPQEPRVPEYKKIPLIFEGEPTTKRPKTGDRKQAAENEEEQNIPKQAKTRKRRVMEDKEFVLPENNIPLREFIENVRRAYSQIPSQDIEISPRYLYNKGLFKKSITEILEKYGLYSSKLNTETCDIREDVNEDIFTPFDHQLIVKDYLNITTPYRGLLLFHGLGSGKTCTSIGVIEGLKYNKKIYILTPASLKKNYKTQLQHCGDQIYKANNFWYFKEIDKNDSALINELSKLTGCPSKYIKKETGLWLVDITRKSNKEELTREDKKKIKEQILISLENKYTFISYNGQLKLRKFFNSFTKNETINPFDHSVVVIDEAHNFISGIVNKLKKPASISMKLYHLLMDADDCRTVLLSGTPIINYPNELAVMMNILRGYIKTLNIKLKVLTNDKVDKNFFKKLFKKYNFVDYFDYKPTSGMLSITKNPYGFVHVYDDKNESDGLILDETGNLTFEDFKLKILKTLSKIPGIKNRSAKLFSIDNKTVTVDNFKNLPDNNDEFTKFFINKSSYEIINKSRLQRRIVGLISYLGDKEKLMPNIVRQNIVEIEMSDYQMPIYAAARGREIDQERRNKKKKKKAAALDELYDEKSGTYRIFSRAYCNFVFPEDMERPLPLRGIETVMEAASNDKDGTIDEDILDPIDEQSKEANLEGKYDEVEGEDVIGEAQGNLYNQKIYRSLKKLSDRKDELFNEEGLSKYSPKFLACLNNIRNPEYNGNHLLYSQFRTLEGIGIFKIVLEANGFVELKLKKTNITTANIQNLNNENIEIPTDVTYVLDIPEDKWNYPKFALYTGTESEYEKELIRNIYNGDWDNLPGPLLSQVKRLGNNNFYGDVCKVLMITSAGAEGINLKNVRFVHVMEPYWHPVRIEQVIGRARRICSHKDLPLELQNIETFLYITRFTKEQISKGEYKEITINDNGMTSDDNLFEILSKKSRINKSLLDTLRETSIDCTINQKNNGGQCFRLPVSDKSTYLTNPDFYQRSGETKTQTKEIQLKTIIIKGVKYIIDEDDKLINFDEYKKNKKKIVKGQRFKDKDGKYKYKLKK